jgi:hypothetical protein
MLPFSPVEGVMVKVRGVKLTVTVQLPVIGFVV